MKTSIKQIIKAITSITLFVAVLGFSSIAGLFENAEEMLTMINLDLSTVVKVILMICFVFAISNLVQFGLSLINPDKKRAGTIITVISSLIQYASAIVIICWGLTILGVNIGTVFASVGVLALIVGFGAESLIADVVTGIFMIFENQYNVGDILEVGGFRGTVKRIGIRTTALTDTGDNIKIINNSEMKNILNRSMDMSRAVCDIGISYEADLNEIEAMLPAILEGIYNSHQDIMLDKPEYLGVQTLGDSAVMLRFVVSVKEKDIYRVGRIMNHDIYLAWKKNGIVCDWDSAAVEVFDRGISRGKYDGSCSVR